MKFEPNRWLDSISLRVLASAAVLAIVIIGTGLFIWEYKYSTATTTQINDLSAQIKALQEEIAKQNNQK